MNLYGASMLSISRCISILAFVLSNAVVSTQAQPNDSVTKLELESPIERQLKSTEAHGYKIELAKSQFLSITIEQKGIDLTVRLVSPEGKVLSDLNKTKGTQGIETLMLIAEAAGDFGVEVTAAERNSTAGLYEIKVVAFRTPSDNDRTVVKARNLLEEASGLRKKGQFDAALALAQQSLALREKLFGPEHLDIADALNQIAIICDDKDELDKAEPLNVRALSIREKHGSFLQPVTLQSAISQWVAFRRSPDRALHSDEL
jgi:hypothetical protein